MIAAAGVLEAQTGGARVATVLPEVRRIYVEPLTGGRDAAALRDLLIAGLNSTGLFVMTEKAETADAILKGAANDTAFIDSFDSDRSLSSRTDGGLYNATSRSGRGAGGYGGASGGDHESYHVRDRKHEAFAAVRLVNQAGDTLWSTTQESLGAKFRSASSDVAAKVARQITLDMNRAGQMAAR